MILLLMPLAAAAAQTQGFGVCKPVAQRSAEEGCWILVDHPLGRAGADEVYWHLDSYADSAQAERARTANAAVVRALGKVWLMTIDATPTRRISDGTHVADIGPLRVRAGREYSATFMEAITPPGFTSAIHRHSGPEAWYTVAGETCLETPAGKIIGRAGVPAVVPQGPPMFLTAAGQQERRAITLILHESEQPPTTMEHEWKPRGLCR